MCCDSTIYIINIYETTLTTRYVHYVFGTQIVCISAKQCKLDKSC